MSYKFRRFEIPERMMNGIKNYVNNGVEPGGFLKAVISNNLFEAVGKADDENIQNLPAFTAYFYNETPSECYGSKEKMNNWIQKQQKRKSYE